MPTTTDYVMVALGVFGLTLTSFYWAWAALRPLILRQQFFEVRDDLRDRIRELGALDDPAYIDARRKLNGLISTGSMLSIATLAHFRNTRMIGFDPTPVLSSNQAVNEVIAAAEKRAHAVLWRYMLYWRPFTGILWPPFWFWSRKLPSLSGWLERNLGALSQAARCCGISDPC